MGKRWSNPITVQGIESDDGRLFNEFIFRDLPLSFRWDKEDDGAHAGAMSVGVMDKVSFDKASGFWMGEGEYADTPEARDAQALAEMGAQFLSADPGAKLEYHFDVLDGNGNIVDPVELEKAFDVMWDGSADERAKTEEWLATLRERMTFDLYEVGGVTQVDIPCWPQCRLALAADPVEQTVTGNIVLGVDRTDPAVQRARVLLRRLASGPAKMHAPYFDQQKLTKWTKFTITDDGQMLGHVASWTACHRSFTNSCVRPDYQTTFPDFHTGEVALDNDCRMRAGVITHHDGHLSSIEDYTRLMEDPAAQLGPVRLYADEFGIQACGQVWPDVDPVEVARTLGGYISGDWRGDAAGKKLFAIAVINTPGYAHYEEEGGEVVRMVASVPPPVALEHLTVEHTFFDVPTSVASAAACACEAIPVTVEAHDHHDDAECHCGGTCGRCSRLSATGVRDLVLLDQTVRSLGPRCNVG